MALPTQVQQQIDKAKEISKEINAAKNEPEAEMSMVEDKQIDPTPAPESSEEVQAEPQAPTEQAENWEKRFKGYKATTDTTLHQLRQQLSSYEDKEQRYQDQINELRKSAYQKPAPTGNVKDWAEKLLSEDERDILGEEGVAAVAKLNAAMLDSATKPLRQQIGTLSQTLQEQRREAQERRRMSEAQEYKTEILSSLSHAMPDWESIDNDANFKDWMGQQDSITGRSRTELFKTAFQTGDVGRIASFYSDWQQQNGGRSPDRRSVPRSKGSDVVPTGRSTQTYTNAGIAQFFDDKRTGKITKKQAAAIEADIRAAVREGRIR